MYKSKSKAMLRGAIMRANLSPRVKPAELAKLAERPINSKMTDDELIEFNSTAKPRSVLLDELRPVVKPLSGQTPLQIATRLNADGWKTAQGRRWDARLVFLLLAFLSGKPVPRVTTRKPKEAAKRSADRNRRSTKGQERPESPKPLTQEELARRLSALGRIKG